MLDAEYHLELLCPFTSLMRIYPTPSVSAYLVEMVPAIQAGTLSQEDASALLGIHIHVCLRYSHLFSRLCLREFNTSI
jgi:hypothetical protein